MGFEVTKNFQKQYRKLDANVQQAIMDAFEKLAENPQSVKFEEKTGPAKGIFTMRAANGFRVAMVKNDDENFVPVFVGNHQKYDLLLSKPKELKPSKLLGHDNSRVVTMDLDIPDTLKKPSLFQVMGDYSLANVKTMGLAALMVSAAALSSLTQASDDVGQRFGHDPEMQRVDAQLAEAGIDPLDANRQIQSMINGDFNREVKPKTQMAERFAENGELEPEPDNGVDIA